MNDYKASPDQDYARLAELAASGGVSVGELIRNASRLNACRGSLSDLGSSGAKQEQTAEAPVRAIPLRLAKLKDTVAAVAQAAVSLELRLIEGGIAVLEKVKAEDADPVMKREEECGMAMELELLSSQLRSTIELLVSLKLRLGV